MLQGGDSGLWSFIPGFFGGSDQSNMAAGYAKTEQHTVVRSSIKLLIWRHKVMTIFYIYSLINYHNQQETFF